MLDERGIQERSKLCTDCVWKVQPSLCTAKTIRAYLLDGVIPKGGTKCDVQQSWPFEPIDYQQIESEEDRQLMEQLEDLARALI